MFYGPPWHKWVLLAFPSDGKSLWDSWKEIGQRIEQGKCRDAKIGANIENEASWWSRDLTKQENPFLCQNREKAERKKPFNRKEKKEDKRQVYAELLVLNNSWK